MIDVKQIEKYLGYNDDAEPEISDTISSLAKEMESEISGKWIYKSFKIGKIMSTHMALEQSEIILTGKSIQNHLKSCEELVIMACTLGQSADRFIQLKTYISPLQGLLSDTIASELIENYCDLCELEIMKNLDENLNMLMRFSPGYGDLSLDCHPQIIKELNAHKSIGLSSNDSHLLIPLKSVIAIIGITHSKEEINDIHRCGNLSCEHCENQSICSFKK